MPDVIKTLNGVQVLVFSADAASITSEPDANALLEQIWAHDASWIAIPVERLSDDFFALHTRLAGTVLQKFVNYRVQVAIVGDLSRHLARSTALNDFVRESNRGAAVWFVPDLDALALRLAGAPASR
ncbi:alpha/beta hydrolase [Paraburkholderia acidicola]|uniref:Alpha/beta hydrolase n=1 Tax=Paraburkholderia acidicola TaxID=1912599 RepID=A0A2A4F4Y6_9BURK|nr:DUF4180 domain-containing protein [Paraburkholderia acidicola]PCE27624.1 alpha/beta hydrolase [Paraburkholderia acidicola]